VPGSAAPTILVADDNEVVRRLLLSVLGQAGYDVIDVPDGDTALVAIRNIEFDLLLLDVQMPGIDGIRLTRLVRSRLDTAHLPIILVTGLGEIEDKVRGLDAGATDFIAKPFDHAELLARVRACLRTKMAFDRLEDAQAVLVALANAVEAKDPSTERHCARLAVLAIDLARDAGLDDAAVEAVGYGAALHDVGKIGVAENILHKHGPLTDTERVAIENHSIVGAGIVAPLRFASDVAPIVRGHHERWDGDGYPDGLSGEAIPIGARIVSIVDTYDAITNDRPYRAGQPRDVALQELRSMSGRQFDPWLVGVFARGGGERSVATSEALLATRGLRQKAG
jgi:putative two-component system response regulator